MLLYQENVVYEKLDLDYERNKLCIFLASDNGKALPHEERTRMRQQLGLMEKYSNVLGERISAFSKLSV